MREGSFWVPVLDATGMLRSGVLPTCGWLAGFQQAGSFFRYVLTQMDGLEFVHGIVEQPAMRLTSQPVEKTVVATENH